MTVRVTDVLLYFTVTTMGAVSLFSTINSLTCLALPEEGLATIVTAVVLLLEPFVSEGVMVVDDMSLK